MAGKLWHRNRRALSGNSKGVFYVKVIFSSSTTALIFSRDGFFLRVLGDLNGFGVIFLVLGWLGTLSRGLYLRLGEDSLKLFLYSTFTFLFKRLLL
jgi:hypothetical protein